MFLLLSIVGCLFLGFFSVWIFGFHRLRWAVAILLFLISNLAITFKFFGSAPSSWLFTFLTGIIQTGVASFLFHVVPFLVGCKLCALLKHK